MNIYVGNLSYDVSEDDLRGHFEKYGEVSSVKIVRDKFTGRSKGFGFVDMPEDSHGEEAINKLNGEMVDGRNLKVNKARPKTDRPQRRDRDY